MLRPVRTHATTDELLITLAEAERDLWARGGVHRHQRRRDLVAAALAAGCTVTDVAHALDATPNDLRAWGVGRT